MILLLSPSRVLRLQACILKQALCGKGKGGRERERKKLLRHDFAQLNKKKPQHPSNSTASNTVSQILCFVFQILNNRWMKLVSNKRIENAIYFPLSRQKLRKILWLEGYKFKSWLHFPNWRIKFFSPTWGIQ